MARRSDRSLAALLLTQRLVETPAAPLKAGEDWSVLDLVGDPGALISGDPGAVARSAGVEGPLADRIAALVGAATSFAFALEDQEQSGLRVIASVDDDYPAALVDRLGRGRRRYFGSLDHDRRRSVRRYPGRLDVQLLYEPHRSV